MERGLSQSAAAAISRSWCDVILATDAESAGAEICVPTHDQILQLPMELQQRGDDQVAVRRPASAVEGRNSGCRH